MFVRTAWCATLALSLLVGCAPAAPVSTTPTTASVAVSGPRVTGVSTLATGPFALAAVRVYRLDNDALVGEGATDATGAFVVPVSAESLGFALRVEVSKDGKSLGAIAARKSGPAAFHVAEATETVIPDVKVTLASTLALRAFIARLKSVSLSLVPPGEKEIPINLLEKLLEAFERLRNSADLTLAALNAAELEAAIARADQPLDTALTDLFSKPGSDFANATDAASKDLANLTAEASGEPAPSDTSSNPDTTTPSTDTPTPAPTPRHRSRGGNPTSDNGTSVNIDGDFSVPTRIPTS